MARQPRQPMLLGDARQRCDQAVGSGPEPRTSTSRPLSVAVIWMSSGLPIEISGSAIAQAASSAPSRCRVEDRAAIDRDDVVRAGRGKADLEHIVRAHPGVQGDAAAAERHGRRPAARPRSRFRPAPASRPRCRASRRDSARSPSAGSRSRRRRRNADRTARSVPGWRARPRPGAGGRDDGPAPARPRRSRRPACRARRRSAPPTMATPSPRWPT